MSFSKPAGQLKITDYNGQLLLVKPTGQEEGVNTSFGAADAIRADVVVLDGPDAGTDYSDILIFQRVLQGQLRPQIGKGLVLGRLGQGEAKAGQSKPWKLLDFTDEDAKVAQAYLDANPGFEKHAAPSAASTPAAAAPLPGGGGPDMAKATQVHDDSAPF